MANWDCPGRAAGRRLKLGACFGPPPTKYQGGSEQVEPGPVRAFVSRTAPVPVAPKSPRISSVIALTRMALAVLT